MQTLLRRLERTLQHRRSLVVAVWAAALLGALPFAARQADHLTGGGFVAMGSQSDHVEHAIERRFPTTAAATLMAVLVPRRDARVGDVVDATRRIDREVSVIGSARVPDAASRAARAGGEFGPHHAVVIPLIITGGETRSIDTAKRLSARLGIEGGDPGRLAGGRVDVHLVGQGALWAAYQELAKQSTTAAEARGFPVIAIVLLAAFGSLVAVALPLGLGFVAVAVTGAVIYALSLTTTMSIYVTNMASMIGIGVAIDYSLFVLARYREEIRAGSGLPQARAAALATSGAAVVFSGLTVIAALSGLFLLPSAGLRSMAAGAIIVVAISVLAASTLLPVLIAILGRRAHQPGLLARALAQGRRPGGHSESGFWPRWTAAVMRRPGRSVLAAAAVLIALAAPTLDLSIGNNAVTQLPAGHEARLGTEAAATVIGAGALGPVRVLVDPSRGTVIDAPNRETVGRIAAALRRDSLVRWVESPVPSRDGRSALLTAILRADPESSAARAAVTRLRARLATFADGRARVEVGGTTAVLVDFDQLVSGSLWKIALFVLALSFAVLLVVLRSIVLPLKAVLMNILSVAAAYGAVVAAFQWGWLRGLGLTHTPEINTIVPPLVLVIAFGLSMDYEIFLLSRIRERRAATGDTARAVAEGLASSARTITSAALIMVAVFLAFVSSGLPAIQQLGLASAVAIAVDATIVRLVLVPAAMALLGDWNWWLPRPLARVLPPVDLEGLRGVSQPTSLPSAATSSNVAGHGPELAR